MPRGDGAPARRPHPHPASALVAAAVVVWTGVFSRLVVLRHARFGTADFDLGIHDQSVWLLANGHSFCTVRGLPVFGHHATFGYYLLVPAYWLGGGPDVLNVFQTAVVALGAVPLYLFARERLGVAWQAAALAGAWLLQPALGFFVWETFHPEVVAMTPLIAAAYAAERNRWNWYALALFAALIWKEDVALFVIGLGVTQLLRRRMRLGAATAAVGAVWFLVTGVWLVPAVAGGGTVYGQLYGDLGDTPAEVVETALHDPSRILERLDENDALGYARDLLAPVAFSALGAPWALIAGLPQAVVNLLSEAEFTHSLRPAYHYAALPLAAVGIGMVEGISALSRLATRRRGAPARGLQRGAVGVAVACAAAATVAWGITPLSVEYDTGYWPLRRDPVHDQARAALDEVPDRAAVSADYSLVPHLAHREEIFTFPNPWVPLNYGIPGEAPRRASPERIEWLVIDTRRLHEADLQLLDELLVADFERVAEHGPVLVARRTGAG